MKLRRRTIVLVVSAIIVAGGTVVGLSVFGLGIFPRGPTLYPCSGVVLNGNYQYNGTGNVTLWLLNNSHADATVISWNLTSDTGAVYSSGQTHVFIRSFDTEAVKATGAPVAGPYNFVISGTYTQQGCAPGTFTRSYRIT